MQIQWREGEVSRCAGVVRRSAEDNTACAGAGGNAKLSLRERVEKRKEEIGSGGRGAERGRRASPAKPRKVFVLWEAVSCGSRDPDGGRA